jgi:trigger factor
MSTATVQDELLRDVQVEQGEGGSVTLQIEVAPEAVVAARQKAIKDYARRMKIPGFRPGHAPANIVRRQVGDEAIAQAVSEKLINDAYQKAVEQSEIRPLTQAQVSGVEFDPFNNEAPMKFSAEMIARPEINLGEIEGVAVQRPRTVISEADVDQGLEALRNENAKLETITDRGAQEGDVLNAELQVFQDGAPKGEEPAKLRSFILGQSGFVPAIDEHLIGAKLDEERRFPVTYPEDFQDPELAGQTVEFAVKITSLKERILPELNDEFASRVGVENVDAMRERMQQMLLITRQRESENFAREQLASKVVENASLEVPSALVDRRVHERIHQFEHELEHEKKTLEQYLEENNQTREEMESTLRDEITAATKRELVLDEIARQQELKVTEDEFEQYYVQMAQAVGQPVETLIERLDAAAIHASLLRRKAIEWLFEKANVEETDAVASETETEATS